MKKLQLCVLTVALIFGLTSMAAAKSAKNTFKKADKPGVVAVEVIQLEATVKAVDPEKRTVTLDGKTGKTITVNAKNARNFDQIMVGDRVKVDYAEELAIFVKKAGGPPDVQGMQTVSLAPKGKKPGGIIADTVEIQANVEGIDYKKRTITLKGPEGNVRTFTVGKNVKNFKEINKGDQVVLRITEAIALEVSKP